MGDESTAGDGTQVPEELKAKLTERGFESIDDLLADRDSIAEERDTFKERHTNAEKLVQRQGAELGQLRKVAGVKPGETSGEPQAGDDTKKPKSVEEQLAEAKASLTPEQKEAADVAYKGATEEEKLAIAGDPAAQLALMRHAQNAVKSIPETLFGSPSQDASSESGNNSSTLGEERIRELFQKERQRGSYYPSGSGGGSATGGSGGDNKQPRQRPVGSGGVLARIERDKAGR